MLRRLSLGAPTALFHFCIAALLQAEGLLLYAHGGARAAAALPLLQLQTFGVSALFGLCAALVWPWRPLRALVLAAVVVLTGVLATDQITMKVFLVHLQLGLSEGGIPDLRRSWESTWAEMDRVSALNFGLLAALAVGLHWPPIHARLSLFAERLLRSPVAGAFCGALLAASLHYGPRLDAFEVRTHPLVSLASSMQKKPQLRPPAECTESAPDRAPVDAPAAPDFSAVRTAARARAHAPNVIFVVMESVGAVQLLKNGAPDPAIAPRLAALAERGAVFENVYGYFPATTRTHVPLATGGRSVTWGSVFDDLSLKWKAPTLASELHAAGLREGLFSAQGLHFENLDGFYKQQAFSIVVDPDQSDYKKLRKPDDSTWGVAERAVIPLALKFAREQKGKPLFLQFLTSSTHHPYIAPGAKKLPPAERYQKAITDTDAAIGELLDGLGPAITDDAIIAVVGDHGESFEERHRGNLLHKSFLYEENIRTFLLVADAKAITRAYRSKQIASVGDVAPTLLALAGRSHADMPGQDLMSAAYKPRILGFHTLAEPALWGLVDGRWKYISRQGGERAELYDLSTDPTEQKNVARVHPELVAEDECRCRRWYVRTDDDFNAHLEGRKKKREALTLADVSKPPPGPIRLELPQARVNPWEPVSVEVEWTPDNESRDEVVEWIAPSGHVTRVTISVDAKQTRTRTELPGPLPLEAGKWTLNVRDDEDDPVMLDGSFEVSAEEPLRVAMSERLPRDFAVTATEAGGLEATWEPADRQLRVVIELTRGAQKRSVDASLEGSPAQQALEELKPPLEAGRWRATLRTPDGKQLGETDVDIPVATQAQR